MSDLPTVWEVVSVADVADVQGGIQKQPKRRPTQNKYPFLRVANVLRGTLDLRDVHEIEIFDGELEKFALRPGDLLVVEGNGSPEQIGRAARWGGEIAACVHQNHLIRVRPTGIDPNYLEYAWHSPVVAEQLRARASSTTGLHTLSTAKLNTIRLPLPPLAEQRRIVATLEEHLSRLETADEQVMTSDSRAARLRDVLIDDALASLDQVPRVPLGTILKEPLRNGHSARASADGEGIRTLTLTAVTNHEFSDANTKLTTARAAQVRDLWLEPDDILIQRANTPELVGTSALYDGPRKWAIYPDLLIRARVNRTALASYVQLVLSSRRIRTFFRTSAKGLAGSMPKIDQATIMQAVIPLPGVDVQQLLVDAVRAKQDSATRLRVSLATAHHRAIHLRRSLLAEAFAGRLVPQDPSDEPASVLLERIRAERAARPTPRRTRRAPVKTRTTKTTPGQETLL